MRYLVLILLNVLVLLLLVECGLALLYHNPFHSDVLARAVSAYYLSHERSIVQYDPLCARYDSKLGYRMLQPGCKFEGREFSTRIDINSLGTRDSEQSLVRPEIVFLGDSFAFGWGVQASERFSSLVAQQAGLSGLTVAVPSYGTARELLMLQEADLSQVKTVVIQFCENDQDENIAFVESGGVLKTMTPESYYEAARQNPSSHGYFPGKYLRYFPAILWSEVNRVAEVQSDQPARDKVDQLLKTLRKSPVRFDAVETIIIFELNPFNRLDPHFAPILQAETAQEPANSVLRKIRTFDLSKSLTERDYFRYDDHLTREGHKIVAGRILEELQ